MCLRVECEALSIMAGFLATPNGRCERCSALDLDGSELSGTTFIAKMVSIVKGKHHPTWHQVCLLVLRDLG